MVRDHGFHPVRIKRIVQETADTRTYVLDAPFPYRAGQFLTVRACGALRSYSMSSSPDTDSELTTTVKRVPGGLVSNWMHDHLAAGDLIETTAPAGVFCLREGAAPLVALCGGSGVTPILSLVKTALATTGRRVRVLAANRDADSVIFGDTLAELAKGHPGRFEIRHHLDDRQGLVTDVEIREFVGGDLSADFYLCGPAPFMALAENTLLGHRVGAGQIVAERFTVPGQAVRRSADGAAEPETASASASEVGQAGGGGTVTVVLAGKRHTVDQHPRESLLESARRAGLMPPFSCEMGNCGTCIARLTEGEAKMRVNNALDDDEVAEGWVLTCQGEPVTPHVTVEYEN
ncbi:2Fe-2S iron-sulfur cluster-binding protein [Streptomyces turgidiscabies]|uniref:Oxidoreductase, FAD-dependent n=1 Tax=Streptomyces turgidiscabies (strain Car8) TaxID=698760 RepID=L7FER7_STRT8|nr:MULTISPECIES: ferredoxin--NADP reductase [Streptomyces]ELP69888.1 oxidoreductase, FAD-dependent [Streptomyces turgidiscabies Car8]MDX3499054.1 ferredoxin--NADP reductase [Streptomyces turgidiscabies]GAQ73503.1 3-ketosteroid-9-alpha-hydroxylase reductase [Streptomyces turgidiscabies]